MKRRRMAEFSQPSSGTDSLASGATRLTSRLSQWPVPALDVSAWGSAKASSLSLIGLDENSRSATSTAVKMAPNSTARNRYCVRFIASDPDVGDLADHEETEQHQGAGDAEHLAPARIGVQRRQEFRVGEVHHGRRAEQQRAQHLGRHLALGRHHPHLAKQLDAVADDGADA